MALDTGEQISVDDFIITVEAGEALSDRDAAYISPSDGKAYKCDADDLQKIGFSGFVVAGAAMGANVNLRHDGQMGGFSGLTIGATYYLSGTAGAITATKPSNYKIVGRALSATVIKITQEPTVRKRVYTADATWTKPIGLRHIEVEAQGPGASGGDVTANTGAGYGGGAGGYCYKRIEAADLGATEAVNVGAIDASDNSTFGSHVTAGYANQQDGGTATGGDLNIEGEDGASGVSDDGAGFALGGKGADSWFGFGGRNAEGNANGQAATGYGAGGGGAGSVAQSADKSGGDGTPGLVVVTEYY